ncbi:MAG: hypothetical protein JNL67_23160 [Planctomycetaceae bacterium]|nr:hypothetical protein [Planctomycetaceae bacterium]
MMNLILLIRLLWAPRHRSVAAVKAAPVRPELGLQRCGQIGCTERVVARVPQGDVCQFATQEARGMLIGESDQIAAAESWIRAMEDFDRF